GRLSTFYENWLDITSDPSVLEAIQGYRIPFSGGIPSRFTHPEPVFSQADTLLCDNELERLQLKEAIVPAEPCTDQFLSSFFLIDKPSGGKRLILNLRDLNQYIDPPHFKFFAFLPFILLPRVLRKIVDDKATGMVVMPWWPSQAWFPLFCHLLASEPLFLLPNRLLLSSPFRDQHPAWRSLSLGVAKLSGKRLRTD
ncbi:hypothetical protein ALC60_12730, partial [Trachymyrmex zeteki]